MPSIKKIKSNINKLEKKVVRSDVEILKGEKKALLVLLLMILIFFIISPFFGESGLDMGWLPPNLVNDDSVFLMFLLLQPIAIFAGIILSIIILVPIVKMRNPTKYAAHIRQQWKEKCESFQTILNEMQEKGWKRVRIA